MLSSAKKKLLRWVWHWPIKVAFFSVCTAVVFVFILLTSVAGFYVFRNALVPKASFTQDVILDYTTALPTGRINLLVPEKQWYDYSTNRKLNDRYLLRGMHYNIDAAIAIPKSHRNYELGRVSVTTHMLDSSSEVVAKSVRPVIIPYQSSVTVVMESIVRFPLYMLGLTESNELLHLRLTLLNDFVEPYRASPTKYVEFTLSSSSFDVQDLRVTVVPRVIGLAHLMYYYPRLSFVVGVGCLTAMQSAVCFFCLLVYLMLNYCLTDQRTPDTNASAAHSASSESGRTTAPNSYVTNRTSGKSRTNGLDYSFESNPTTPNSQTSQHSFSRRSSGSNSSKYRTDSYRGLGWSAASTTHVGSLTVAELLDDSATCFSNARDVLIDSLTADTGDLHIDHDAAATPMSSTSTSDNSNSSSSSHEIYDYDDDDNGTSLLSYLTSGWGLKNKTD